MSFRGHGSCIVDPTNYNKMMNFWKHFWAILTLFGLFRHFRSSEGHTMYETLMETCTFWTKWGVFQVPTTNGSWDIWFGCFWAYFWANLTLFGLFRHFRSSEGHTMYQTLIETCTFWGLAVKTRGQLSSYGQWFVRYWNWAFSHIFATFSPKLGLPVGQKPFSS